jgi:hypothetical protein
MRRLGLLLLVTLCGCTYSSQHPAVAAGIAAGTIGFGACEIDSVKTSTCGIIGGSTGLVLGGIAALVTLIADTGAHDLPADDELPPGTGADIRVRTHTAPPPVLPDAGVDGTAPSPADAGPPPDAPPAPPADAGVDSAA